MPVAPTNQIKSSVNGTGQFKLAWGGYGYARYGMSYYGQGGGVINQTKSSGVTNFIVTDEADFIITDEGDFIVTSIGGGITNQSKS